MTNRLILFVVLVVCKVFRSKEQLGGPVFDSNYHCGQTVVIGADRQTDYFVPSCMQGHPDVKINLARYR